MKLKKLTAVFAAVVIAAVSLAGCGGSSSSGSGTASTSGSGSEQAAASTQSGEKTKLYVVNWKDYASDDP